MAVATAYGYKQFVVHSFLESMICYYEIGRVTFPAKKLKTIRKMIFVMFPGD
jgi:hypothetical protein